MPSVACASGPRPARSFWSRRWRPRSARRLRDRRAGCGSCVRPSRPACLCSQPWLGPRAMAWRARPARRAAPGRRPDPPRRTGSGPAVVSCAIRRCRRACTGTHGRGRGLLRPRQRQRQSASRRHRSAEDERAAKHRQIARRMAREDPHGLGKRPAGRDFSPVRRECPRRARRPRLAGECRVDPVANVPPAMDRLRRRRNPPPCRGDRDDAGRAAEGEPESRTGLRPGNLQASERDRTAVPEIQGLPAPLHAVRQARRDVSGLPEPRGRRRNDI